MGRSNMKELVLKLKTGDQDRMEAALGAVLTFEGTEWFAMDKANKQVTVQGENLDIASLISKLNKFVHVEFVTTRQKDEKKPAIQKKHEKKPAIQKKDEKKPAIEKKDEKKPAMMKDEKKPAIEKKDEKNPAMMKDEKKPAIEKKEG